MSEKENAETIPKRVLVDADLLVRRVAPTITVPLRWVIEPNRYLTSISPRLIGGLTRWG